MMEAKMADNSHALSQIEELKQRLQVTTKFAARLATELVARQALDQRGVRKIIQDLKPEEREGLSAEEKARSEIDGWQVALIEQEFVAQLGR
jgi:hypothetical protein